MILNVFFCGFLGFFFHSIHYIIYDILELMKSAKQMLVIKLMYLLPILFFAVAYFGLTTTGEDILQGAGRLWSGSEINLVEDVKNSFDNNGRITDMYAWSVIDLFDYQFQFGPDLVFRLLDLAMAGGLFYLMSYAILGRKPKLEFKDASLFLVLFATVILTPHGRIMYAGFSAIHNYMIGAFIFMAFCLPYIKLVLGKENCKKWWMTVLMLVFGIVFGMSSALTPIAFFVVALGYILIGKRRIKIPLWAIVGLAGLVIGVVISNVFGPGAGNYSNNDVYTGTYDYVAFSEILNNIPRIIKHLIVNIGRVILPAAILAGILFVFCINPRRFFSAKFYEKIEKKRMRLIMSELAFAIILILGSFQVSAPIRILLPAYLALVMVVLTVFWPEIQKEKVIGCGAMVLVIGIVVAKSILTINYHEQSSVVLKKIEDAETESVCVTPVEVEAFNYPVVYLGQENMVMEWAVPETIHGKTVTFCENN